ncbi:MAG: ParB/RepB/Spo0J family partition protein [Pseudonocardiaceae bacterium]
MGRRRVVGDEAVAVSNPTSVPVSSIAHNPRNPRDDYNDVTELAASIREVGVLQPLGVVRYEVFLTHYPDCEDQVGTHDWVVLHGNRRLEAARQAGLTEVPVNVMDHLGRDKQFDEAVLVENIHRAALPPLREAAALAALVELHGSQREVARRIGKSQGFVSQRLMLLELPDELRAALAGHQVTVEQARKIAALPADTQRRIVAAGPPYGLATVVAQTTTAVGHAPAGNLTPTPQIPGQPSAGERAGATRQEMMVIRVPAHSPERLAAALRDRYSTAELAELMRLLGAPVITP